MVVGGLQLLFVRGLDKPLSFLSKTTALGIEFPSHRYTEEVTHRIKSWDERTSQPVARGSVYRGLRLIPAMPVDNEHYIVATEAGVAARTISQMLDPLCRLFCRYISGIIQGARAVQPINYLPSS